MVTTGASMVKLAPPPTVVRTWGATRRLRRGVAHRGTAQAVITAGRDCQAVGKCSGGSSAATKRLCALRDGDRVLEVAHQAAADGVEDGISRGLARRSEPGQRKGDLP